MSAPHRPPSDDAWRGGTPEWADFDGDLLDSPALGRGQAAGHISSTDAGPLSAADGGIDLGREPEGDLDLGTTFTGAVSPRRTGVGHNRRAQALSAAGAGLAVVLALMIHAATESVSDRSAPAGAGALAHVSPTVKPHHALRATRFPELSREPRRRASRPARVAAERAAVHAAPTVIASSPSVSHSTRPAAEFGFER